jgi:hypothetical protein
MDQLSLAIGIPTYEGGRALCVTLQTIYRQTRLESVSQVLVAVDGNHLAPQVRAAIQHPKLTIIEFAERAGQARRINDLLERLRGDVIVLTNDDVILDDTALERLASRFAGLDRSPGLVAGHVRPLPASGPLQSCLELSYRLQRALARAWNRGDNYLSCNGRLVALSAELASQLRIPATVRNNDAYLYLAASQLGFGFETANDAVCWYRNPRTLREHRRQSLRFQDSGRENQAYFSSHVLDRFSPPLEARITALARVAREQPVRLAAYLGLYAYTRAVARLDGPAGEPAAIWNTDRSTKEI